MARYREKDETDLAWNRTRRQLTRDLDTRIQNLREELLNDILAGAWETYVNELSKDKPNLVALEDEATRWVEDVLRRQLKPKAIEGMNGDLAKA